MPLWRILRAVLHALHGIGIVLVRWRWLDTAGREARIAWWAGKMLRVLGIALDASGQFRPGAVLLVANHVSWLDILAIHALCPRARFVSKADVAAWPLIGRLVDAAGTLYLERERKRDALRVVHRCAEALRGGEAVAVFPEGTTGEGRSLLPFHANLLQAAIASGTPVQPVALRYREPGQPFSDAALWLGDTTLATSLWRIASARRLSVRVSVLPALGSRHAERRALAARLRALIALELGVPV